MSLLVGLAGPKGCGKSTVAAALVELGRYHLGAQGLGTASICVRQRFAGPLKDMLRTLGLTDAQVDGDEKETPSELLCGAAPRYAMQTLGTDWGRRLLGENLWVNATMLRVDADLDLGHVVVIDDLRFDNEALAIRERGGLIIQLQRPSVSYTGEHASEVGVSGHLVDHIVPNAGTPDACAQHVLQLLRKHNP